MEISRGTAPSAGGGWPRRKVQLSLALAFGCLPARMALWGGGGAQIFLPIFDGSSGEIHRNFQSRLLLR